MKDWKVEKSTRRHRMPWTPEESRIVRACARGWMHHWFAAERVAVKAAAQALRRAGLGGRRTDDAIRYKLESEAEKLGRRRSRARWTASEDRTIDRFARAVARDEYTDATAAARVCRKALSRHKLAFPRTLASIAVRISQRAREFGRPPARVVFTPEESELLLRLARAVSLGRFQQVRDASKTFVSEMSRRHRKPEMGSRPPVRTLDALDRKLWHVARDAGLAWGFRDWSQDEDRVVDRFIRRYAEGRYRSLRHTAKACRVALRRLDASRRKSPERGRPYRRSFLAIHQHLTSRAHESNVTMPLFRRWRGVERRIADQCARRILYDPISYKRKRMSYVVALQVKLRSLGYPRTLGACRGEIERALERGISDRG